MEAKAPPILAPHTSATRTLSKRSSTKPDLDSTRGRSPASEPGASLKRSRTRSGSRRDIQRRRRNYSEQHRLLLNDAINHAADPNLAAREEEQSYHSSQVGYSFWSASEKSKLFSALDRHGRSDVRKIADATGTKSVLEVDGYLNLLDRALKEQHAEHRRSTLLRYADIPAVYEVSTECCKALEAAADGLQIYQGSYEDNVERSRHGRYWRLTQDLAWEIEDTRINPDDDDDLENSPEEEDPHFQALEPAATLFDLPMWLELSERIFMNRPLGPSSSDEADDGSPRHWLDITQDVSDTPAIFATAFSNFYNLAVSITKRIVSTTLFHTMSRLRTTDFSNPNRIEQVTKQDIRTAVDILGLKHSSDDFWVGAARRLGLHIYDAVNRSNRPVQRKHKLGPRLSYDEIEQMLKAPWSVWKKHHRTHVKTLLSEMNPPEQNLDDPELSDTDLAIVPLPERTTSDELAAQHEDEAEMLDTAASAQEEARLWTELLERPVPEECQRQIQSEEPARDSAPRPRVQRKRAEDFVDWRECTDYCAPWERDGYEFDFNDARNRLERRRQRRLALRAQLEGEDSSPSSDSSERRSSSADEDEESSGSSDAATEGSSESSSGESSTESAEEGESSEEGEEEDGTDNSLSSGTRSRIRRRRRWYPKLQPLHPSHNIKLGDMDTSD